MSTHTRPRSLRGLDVDDDTLRVPIASLNPAHVNPRRGQVPVIAASLRELGQYRALVVNRGTHTGRPNEVLAGNHTREAMLQLGWTHAAVTYVDVSEKKAAKIIAVDNRSSDLATNDDATTALLLAELEGDYIGTGFDAWDTDDVATRLRDAEDKAPRLPTGETAPRRSDRTRVIQCPSCQHQFDATSAVEIRQPNNAGGRA